MRLIRRKFALPLLFLSVALGSIWLATAFYGTSAVRTEHIIETKLNIPTGITDISDTEDARPQPPWYYCRTRAITPLLVRVDYGHVRGPLEGSGGTAYYFWCFGFSRLLVDRKTWNL